MSDSVILDHRDFVREELEKRQRKNPAYSARAFARALGLSSGYLSDLLKGEKVLSEKRALGIARLLKWKKSKIDLFVLLVRYARIQDPALRSELIAEIATKRAIDIRYKELGSDEFQLISEWFHGAIFELGGLPDFEMNPASIARRLGISELQAREGVERLVRLGLLEAKAPHSYAKARAQVLMPSQSAQSLAMGKYHAEMLRKAAQSIAKQPIAERDNTGLTVAISRTQLPEVKKRIERFREELAAFFDAEKAPDSVYQLSLHFFALDK